MLIEAIGIVSVVFQEYPLLTAFMVIALEVPRYTLSIFAMGFLGLARKHHDPAISAPISVIVPIHNGVRDTKIALATLASQRQPIHEIILIDDGSDEDQSKQLQAIANEYPLVKLLRHRRRSGKSAGVNHAAYIATGELLLVMDHDTWVHPEAIERLAQAMTNRQVALASGNLLVSNRQRNPLTSLQSLEYLLAITIGRGFLTRIGAIGCCSGAFSMFRASSFKAVGGMNVGPGEDLEITLRLRQAGYQIRFVKNAVAETSVPQTVRSLIQQRLRWDGDAVATRLFMYREWSLFQREHSLGGWLERLDYLLLELLPTLIFPFYLLVLWMDYGANMIDILIAIYVVLFWLYTLNILAAIVVAHRRLSMLDILVLPLMPIYQGLVMRFVRLIAISDEILLATSQRSTFVPQRIRDALYGRPTQ
jgi:cellulose synthase/poly-beta-1,6-N-acetylglucosamine synthase-like glycosyltransferase